ncbi:unnamed protein product, partial [Amoebophrya sp. A25]
ERRLPRRCSASSFSQLCFVVLLHLAATSSEKLASAQPLQHTASSGSRRGAASHVAHRLRSSALPPAPITSGVANNFENRKNQGDYFDAVARTKILQKLRNQGQAKLYSEEGEAEVDIPARNEEGQGRVERITDLDYLVSSTTTSSASSDFEDNLPISLQRDALLRRVSETPGNSGIDTDKDVDTVLEHVIVDEEVVLEQVNNDDITARNRDYNTEKRGRHLQTTSLSPALTTSAIPVPFTCPADAFLLDQALAFTASTTLTSSTTTYDYFYGAGSTSTSSRGIGVRTGSVESSGSAGAFSSGTSSGSSGTSSGAGSGGSSSSSGQDTGSGNTTTTATVVTAALPIPSAGCACDNGQFGLPGNCTVCPFSWLSVEYTKTDHSGGTSTTDCVCHPTQFGTSRPNVAAGGTNVPFSSDNLCEGKCPVLGGTQLQLPGCFERPEYRFYKAALGNTTTAPSSNVSDTSTSSSNTSSANSSSTATTTWAPATTTSSPTTTGGASNSS